MSADCELEQKKLEQKLKKIERKREKLKRKRKKLRQELRKQEDKDYTNSLTRLSLFVVAGGLIVSVWFSYFNALGDKSEFPNYDPVHNWILIVSISIFVATLFAILFDEFRRSLMSAGSSRSLLRVLRWLEFIVIPIVVAVVALLVLFIVTRKFEPVL